MCVCVCVCGGMIDCLTLSTLSFLSAVSIVLSVSNPECVQSRVQWVKM